MRHPIESLKLTISALLVLGGLVCLLSSSYDSSVHAGSAAPLPALPARLPEGIPTGKWLTLIPTDNPLTAEKVALGERLYFDKRLSADGSVSCATCHDPAAAFADHNQIAIGATGKVGVRNAPTILNAMFNEVLFWDGRARSLEEQAKQPLINPVEMGMPDHDAVVARLAAIPEYRHKFRQVFGREGITIDTIVKAIAAFERTKLSGNSPFDRFIAGDRRAITDAQKRGWQLFKGKAECIRCHTFSPSSPFFTDFKFYNTGVATRGRNFDQLARQRDQFEFDKTGMDQALSLLAHTSGLSELGRYLVTRQAKDIGAFKTPTLRDVELTPPYMHNGSEKTLLDVVRFYNRGGEPNARLSDRIRPLNLTDAEMSDLVEFMRSLTSDDVLRTVQNARPQTRLPVALPSP